MVTACPVSIECQVVEFVECGALTNIIARVTRREVEEDLIDEDGTFKSDTFSPISYIGDGAGRYYRNYKDGGVQMGSIIKKIRENEE